MPWNNQGVVAPFVESIGPLGSHWAQVLIEDGQINFNLAAALAGPYKNVAGLGLAQYQSGPTGATALQLSGGYVLSNGAGGGTAILAPSGDLSGIADAAVINLFLALGYDVELLPGIFYTDIPLLVWTQETLSGAGPATMIQAVSGFTGNYMVQLGNPATTVQATVRDLALWGGAPNASNLLTGPGGIQLDNTGLSTSGDMPADIGDSLHVLENLLVMNMGGDGCHFDNHVRELRCKNVRVYRVQGNGMYLGDAGGAGSGCTDSHFTDCTTGFTAEDGWLILNSNNMIQGNKAFAAGNNFYGGFTGTTQVGFRFSGSQCNINTAVNNQAQQCALHGFSLESCVDVSLTGNQADSNGAGTGVSTGVGINVDAATGCTITDNVGKQQLTPGNQIWGVQAAGGCKDTVIRDNPISGTSGTFTSSATNLNRGTATLSAGTATVANDSVTAASMILLTTISPGGTPGAVFVSAITAGTSFTIESTSATDTSTVAWEIVY